MASNSFLERVFTPPGRDARLLRALYAEFIGTLLFVFFVGLARHEALAVGMAYGVLVYATQQTSGGHLNPAITLATTLSGHFHWVTSLMYIIAQLVGGVVGALLQVALVPNVHFGQQPASPGCWDPAGNLANAELWGWEVILTFTLVYVLYSTAIATPGHGSLSPLALGFTYYVIVYVAGPWTGGNANPARVVAGLIVFGCNLHGAWWIYLLAQVIGALLASLVAGSVFGYGSTYSNAATGERREPLLGSRDPENP